MTASRRSINCSTQRRGQKHLVEVESRNANVYARQALAQRTPRQAS